MKPAPFSYARPATLDRAIEVLSGAEDGKVLGGGQSLVPMLNFRLARPEVLVDVRRIPELQVLGERNEKLAIGAGVTQRTVECAEIVATSCPLIERALHLVGHVQTRSRGTFGGSLAHADPSAELPAAALALDATFVAASPRGVREIEAVEFFLGPYMTALEFDEVLVEVRLPIEPNSRAAFNEVSRRAGDFAMAGVGVQLQFDGDRVASARVAATGVELAPTRLTSVEQVLVGAVVTTDLADEAGRIAARCVDARADANASPEYRQELLETLVKRSILEVAQ